MNINEYKIRPSKHFALTWMRKWDYDIYSVRNALESAYKIEKVGKNKYEAYTKSREGSNQCNEEFPYEEETQKTVETARKLGVWPEPLKLYRSLSKSGGGLIFRIPVDIEKQMRLKENTPIEITKIGNKIVIEPEK